MTKTEREAVEQLANALQAAAPLATLVRQSIGAQIDTAVQLEAAVDRAVRAVKELQPRKERGR